MFIIIWILHFSNISTSQITQNHCCITKQRTLNLLLEGTTPLLGGTHSGRDG